MLPITLTMAAAAALLNIWLAIRCVQVRYKGQVLHGDGGNTLLLSRMRAQANFAEYTPFFLILLGLIEYAEGPRRWLWGISIVFVAARVIHPFGMDRREPSILRAAPTIATWLSLAGLAGAALWIVAHGR